MKKTKSDNKGLSVISKSSLIFLLVATINKASASHSHARYITHSKGMLSDEKFLQLNPDWDDSYVSQAVSQAQYKPKKDAIPLEELNSAQTIEANFKKSVLKNK